MSVLWLLPAAGLPVLKHYQGQRFTGFLHPTSDPSGATYNITQSKTAVGAGGFGGRGVSGASQTRLDYLPEHATDFVFASFAEQRGFLGVSILLLLYLLVVWRGLRIVTLRRRPLQRHRGGRDRLRLPLPGVRQRRHDDGRCAGDGHPAPVRHGRRLVDGREPARDRRAAVDSRARPRSRRGADAARGTRRPRRPRRRPRGTRHGRSTAPLVVTGMLSAELARALERRRRGRRLRSGRHQHPAGAAALVVVLGGAATAETSGCCGQASRASVPVVAVQTDPRAETPLPYVPAAAVVVCQPGQSFPVDGDRRVRWRDSSVTTPSPWPRACRSSAMLIVAQLVREGRTAGGRRRSAAVAERRRPAGADADPGAARARHRGGARSRDRQGAGDRAGRGRRARGSAPARWSGGCPGACR